MSIDREALEKAARAVCAADGQDWNVLASTYNGRERIRDYVRFAEAAINTRTTAKEDSHG